MGLGTSPWTKVFHEVPVDQKNQCCNVVLCPLMNLPIRKSLIKSKQLIESQMRFLQRLGAKINLGTLLAMLSEPINHQGRHHPQHFHDNPHSHHPSAKINLVVI